MLPQQQYPGPLNASMSMYSGQMQQSFGFNPAQGSMHNSNTTDQNSPELFKQNLANAQREVLRVQGLARDALSGIQNAYHPGQSPANTSRLIAEVKEALEHLMQLLRATGVGALPTLPATGAPITPPTEAELLANANATVKTLYDTLKRKQESAAVVANLLGAAAGR